MAKKITKKENFEKIMGVVAEYPELVEFCQHEIELLNKKNSKGNSKVAKENKVIAEMLKEQLEIIGRPVTITELMQNSQVVKDYVCENGRPLSNQKITSIFNKLIDSNEVVRTRDKRNSLFSLV